MIQISIVQKVVWMFQMMLKNIYLYIQENKIIEQKMTHMVYLQFVNLLTNYALLLIVDSMTYYNCTSVGLRMPLGCCHLNNEIHMMVLEILICVLHADCSRWGH